MLLDETRGIRIHTSKHPVCRCSMFAIMRFDVGWKKHRKKNVPSTSIASVPVCLLHFVFIVLVAYHSQSYSVVQCTRLASQYCLEFRFGVVNCLCRFCLCIVRCATHSLRIQICIFLLYTNNFQKKNKKKSNSACKQRYLPLAFKACLNVLVVEQFVFDENSE